MSAFNTKRDLTMGSAFSKFAAVSMILLVGSQVSAEPKSLTIQGVDGLDGETIILDSNADAEIDIAVNESGVVITLPVKVRVKCYGDETADGYCLLAASDGVAAPPANDPPADDPPADDPPADDPPADDPPPSSGYCTNNTVQANCSASRNLDNIYKDSKDFRPSIGRGRIETYPFTLDAVQSFQSGSFDFVTSNSPFKGDFYFRVWISKAPGGVPYNDVGCDVYKTQARGAFEWSQGGNKSDYRCDLPAGGGVFYANLAITSCVAIGNTTCQGSAGQYSGYNETYLFDFGTKP